MGYTINTVAHTACARFYNTYTKMHREKATSTHLWLTMNPSFSLLWILVSIIRWQYGSCHADPCHCISPQLIQYQKYFPYIAPMQQEQQHRNYESYLSLCVIQITSLIALFPKEPPVKCLTDFKSNAHQRSKYFDRVLSSTRLHCVVESCIPPNSTPIFIVALLDTATTST